MCSATSGGQACPGVAVGNAVVLHVLPLKKKKKCIYIHCISLHLIVLRMNWGLTVLGTNIVFANIKQWQCFTSEIRSRVTDLRRMLWTLEGGMRVRMKRVNAFYFESFFLFLFLELTFSCNKPHPENT